MNDLKKKARSTKEFVKKHRVALAVTATVTTMVAINRKALKQHDDFLKERGLYEEFYFAEEE